MAKLLFRVVRGLVLAAVGLVALIVVIGEIAKRGPSASRPSTSSTAASAPAPAMPAPEAPKPQAPKLERDVVEVLVRSIADSAAAPNDMARGGLRMPRGRALCALIKPLRGEVTDWRGTVAKLDSANDGSGVLAVLVAPDVTLETSNNTFSDSDEHTLLKPGSKVFIAAAALSVGQPVTFSGNFFHDPVDCMKEQSLTTEGELSEPEFLFHFTAITPAAAGN